LTDADCYKITRLAFVPNTIYVCKSDIQYFGMNVHFLTAENVIPFLTVCYLPIV